MDQNAAASEAMLTRTAMPAASALTQGRLVGFGLLVSFGLGMFTNFQLQPQLFADGGFMVQAGQQPRLAGIIVVLGVITSLIMLAIASTVRRRTAAQLPLLSLGYLLLVTAGLATSLMEHAVLLAMRPLSEAFLAAGPEATARFDEVKLLLSALRNGIHFPDKLLGGLSVFLLFLVCSRARLIPAPVALAGMVAAVCQMTAILRVLLGFDMIYALLAPLALVYPLTGCWLLVKGFTASESTPAMR